MSWFLLGILVGIVATTVYIVTHSEGVEVEILGKVYKIK